MVKQRNKGTNTILQNSNSSSTPYGSASGRHGSLQTCQAAQLNAFFSLWKKPANVYQRDARVLYLLCIVVGIVLTSLPSRLETLYLIQEFRYPFDELFLIVINTIIGGLSGGYVANIAMPKYLQSTNAWPWLLISLIAPLCINISVLIIGLGFSIWVQLLGIYLIYLFVRRKIRSFKQ